jgi:hypothetical protein
MLPCGMPSFRINMALLAESGVLRSARNFKLMPQGEDEIDITPTAPDDPEQKGSRHVR